MSDSARSRRYASTCWRPVFGNLSPSAREVPWRVCNWKSGSRIPRNWPRTMSCRRSARANPGTGTSRHAAIATRWRRVSCIPTVGPTWPCWRSRWKIRRPRASTRRVRCSWIQRHADAWTNLGVASWHAGQHREGAQAMSQALQFAPGLAAGRPELRADASGGGAAGAGARHAGCGGAGQPRRMAAAPGAGRNRPPARTPRRGPPPRAGGAGHGRR